MAVTRHVHKIECYPSSAYWSSTQFEKLLNKKLGIHERIVQIRWPETAANSGYAWIITEELVMGPPTL